MADEKKEKEPILTALLNFFTGGGGYIYIGQMAKGGVFIAGALVFAGMACCLMLMMASAGFGMTLFGLLAFVPLFFWWLIAIAAAWDGYRMTQRLNEGHELGKWEFTTARK
jgi:hypothetical protein